MRLLCAVAKLADKIFLQIRVFPPKFEIALSSSNSLLQGKTFFGFFSKASNHEAAFAKATARQVDTNEHKFIRIRFRSSFRLIRVDSCEFVVTQRGRACATFVKRRHHAPNQLGAILRPSSKLARR